MNNKDALRRMLREALPPVVDRAPSRDCWPSVVDRRRAPSRWPWLDFGVAAAVVLALSLFPSWLWLLVYHL